VMTQPPRDPKSHILNAHSIRDLLSAGLVMGLLAIANFLLIFNRSGVDPFAGEFPASVVVHATTMTYVTVLVCQLFNIAQRRGGRGLFTRYTVSNPTYWFACLAGVAIMIAIVYVPWLQAMFKTGPLDLVDWALVTVAAVSDTRFACSDTAQQPGDLRLY